MKHMRMAVYVVLAFDMKLVGHYIVTHEYSFYVVHFYPSRAAMRKADRYVIPTAVIRIATRNDPDSVFDILVGA